MQSNTQCIPDPNELQAYSIGKATPQRAAEIETYLAEHPECSTILEAAPDDIVIQHLRGAGILAATTCELQNAATVDVAARRPESAAGGQLTQALPEPIPADRSSTTPAGILTNHPRYQLLRKLGEGGMGAVFLAEHRLMLRTVALKMIRTSCLTNSQAVERFRREMQAAASLSHTNIVTAYDAEEAGGVHFLVMEYVEGIALNEWLAERGPLPAVEACQYVRQAALGLQYAHEKGMVHRDLKPHNLMRTPEGTVKILDFGLARFVREIGSSPQDQLTAEGTVMGTPDYMAPEQGKDSSHADIRADIYSLGCTLYHFLTGQVPFPRGTFIDKIIKHTMEEPEPLSKFRPDLPAGLTDVVARMMAKEPATRYQTPFEVAEALTPFCSAAPPRLPPLPPARRRRWLAVGLLGAAALAVVLAVVITIKTRKGVVTIQVEDSDIEVVTRQNGDIVRIHDRKADKTWELDTQKMQLSRADDPDGLRIELSGREPLTLRRRDGRLVAVVRAGTPLVAEQPHATRQPKFSIASLKPGTKLYDDDFKDPAKSEFKASAPEDFKGDHCEFAGGCFARVFCEDGLGYWADFPDQSLSDFICQVRGRASGRAEGSWGVYFLGTPKDRTFSIMVRGDGQVEVGPNVFTKKYPAPRVGPLAAPKEYKPGEFATLTVVRRGLDFSIYLDGLLMGKPFTLEKPLGKCNCGLMALQHGKAPVRIEFQRLTLWDLPAVQP